jgi:hypothetical protein
MPVTPPPFKIKNEPFDTALDSLKKMDWACPKSVIWEVQNYKNC